MHQDWDNNIAKINAETMEWEMVPVVGLPGNRFYPSDAVFTKENRIYVFGGTPRLDNHTDLSSRDIWYIDVSGDSTPTPTTSTTAQTSTTESPQTNTPGTIPSTTPLPPTTPPSPPFDCSNKPDGFYASPYACDRYFGCLGGETFEFQCSPPFHFNPDQQVCDLPELVNCDLGCSGKENGFYPHWHYCNFYLRCSEGVGVVLECPSPLLFDRVEHKCNFPHLVNCTDIA